MQREFSLVIIIVMMIRIALVLVSSLVLLSFVRSFIRLSGLIVQLALARLCKLACVYVCLLQSLAAFLRAHRAVRLRVLFWLFVVVVVRLSVSQSVSRPFDCWTARESRPAEEQNSLELCSRIRHPHQQRFGLASRISGSGGGGERQMGEVYQEAVASSWLLAGHLFPPRRLFASPSSRILTPSPSPCVNSTPAPPPLARLCVPLSVRSRLGSTTGAHTGCSGRQTGTLLSPVAHPASFCVPPATNPPLTTRWAIVVNGQRHRDNGTI